MILWSMGIPWWTQLSHLPFMYLHHLFQPRLTETFWKQKKKNYLMKKLVHFHIEWFLNKWDLSSLAAFYIHNNAAFWCDIGRMVLILEWKYRRSRSVNIVWSIFGSKRFSCCSNRTEHVFISQPMNYKGVEKDRHMFSLQSWVRCIKIITMKSFMLNST